MAVNYEPKVLTKQSKEHNVSGYKWSTTHSAPMLPKQNGRNIYLIIKTKRPPGYHNNYFVAIDVLGRMMYGYTLLLPMNPECSTNKTRMVK